MEKTLSQLNQEMAVINVAGINERTRQTVFAKYPIGMSQYLATEYLRTANDRPPGLPGWSRSPWMAADRQLQQQDSDFSGSSFRIGFDFDELRVKARWSAEICLQLMRGRDQLTGYTSAADFTTDQGIKPPSPDGRATTLEGCCRRLTDPSWWRKKLRRLMYKKTEAVERRIGLVQAQAGLYASDDAVERRRADKARSRSFLEETLAINDLGHEMSLAEISDCTVSNPANRRAELMTRSRGFEEYASQLGHVALFLTLTVPSRFHAYRRDGVANPKWDGSSPADAQKWLSATWARIRAALDRQGITLYGFRVAEPHHDGTPHWHMLLFLEPAGESAVLATFRKYMLQETPDEKGARKHRFSAKRIDPTRGSATGYLAKYIAKNIDGSTNDLDFEDSIQQRSTKDTVIRADAWASIWSIRQFQQIGGPPVGVWRELRRVDTPLAGILELARQAADQGDWSQFMHAMGGHEARFRNQAIIILRVWVDEPGTYGDPIGYTTVGVSSDGITVTTRLREWRFEWKGSNSPSRTCVNNCTPCTDNSTTVPRECFGDQMNQPP